MLSYCGNTWSNLDDELILLTVHVLHVSVSTKDSRLNTCEEHKRLFTLDICKRNLFTCFTVLILSLLAISPLRDFALYVKPRVNVLIYIFIKSLTLIRQIQQ